MFVADGISALRQYACVLSHQELIDSLARLKDDNRATNAEIARLINVPSSRVAEIFNGKRAVKVDEMKALVEHYGLDAHAPSVISEELLTPIVGEIVDLARSSPAAPATRPLAEALSRYLRQIGSRPSIHASQDALEAVAQALVSPALGETRPA